MPRLPLKQLKRLPVKTRSGIFLGYVRDFLVETEGQTIMHYFVARSPIAAKKLLIGRDQIIAIQSDVILVDDAVTLKDDRSVLEKKTVGVQAKPIAMRDNT